MVNMNQRVLNNYLQKQISQQVPSIYTKDSAVIKWGEEQVDKAIRELDDHFEETLDPVRQTFENSLSTEETKESTGVSKGIFSKLSFGKKKPAADVQGQGVAETD